MFAPTATSAAPTRFAAPAAASLSIAQRIELMDHEGMAACSSGDAARWAAYFEATGNTICGRRPIGAILRGFLSGGDVVGDDDAVTRGLPPWTASWVHYDQSSACQKASDSSVSYASAVLWQQHQAAP
jgi:predicted class III extradiol MEMO1 family dioxygenase